MLELRRGFSTLVLFILLEISRRTRWWCLKCVIVYLARDILAFVMYCINGESGSSLLIESINSMIGLYLYISRIGLGTKYDMHILFLEGKQVVVYFFFYSLSFSFNTFYLKCLYLEPH